MTYSVINAAGEVEPGQSGLTLAQARDRAKSNLGSYNPFCRVRSDADGATGVIAGVHAKRGTALLEWA